MTKRKAFVDTSILTDLLLKPTGKGRVAKAALARYEHSMLPVYAIKEFKKGPVRYFRYLHNVFAKTKSFSDSIAALNGLMQSGQKYMPKTALEALSEASAAIADLGLSNAEMAEKGGPEISHDEALADFYRSSIRSAIARAWLRRRVAFSQVTGELSCYKEVPPYVDSRTGLLEIDPHHCGVSECCLGKSLSKRINDLQKLEDVLQPIANLKSENKTRLKVIHETRRKPSQKLSEEYCDGIGDAYFALFAPHDADILTTNLSDHRLLAEALNKTAESPATLGIDPKAL